VSELPLDDHKRDSFAAHLDGAGVAELVWANRRRTPAARAVLRSWTRIPDGEQGQPQVGPQSTQKSAPTGSPARC
jgi:hypothetical protein